MIICWHEIQTSQWNERVCERRLGLYYRLGWLIRQTIIIMTVVMSRRAKRARIELLLQTRWSQITTTDGGSAWRFEKGSTTVRVPTSDRRRRAIWHSRNVAATAERSTSRAIEVVLLGFPVHHGAALGFPRRRRTSPGGGAGFFHAPPRYHRRDRGGGERRPYTPARSANNQSVYEPSPTSVYDGGSRQNKIITAHTRNDGWPEQLLKTFDNVV